MVRRIDTTGAGDLALADPSSLAFDPAAGLFLVSDANANGRNADAPNFFEVDRATGRVVRALDLSEFTRDPSGLALDPRTGTLLVSDDDELELHEITRDGRLLRTLDLADLGASDPEGIAVDPATGNRFIADGRAQQVVVVSPEGQRLGSLGFARHGFQDAEAITFDPERRHLLIAEGKHGGLFELDLTGELVAAWDLAPLGVVRARGLALADGGTAGSVLFIADERVEDAVDGRIIEAALQRLPEGVRWLASRVGDVDGFGFRGDEPGFAAADADHDGRLEPGERLPSSVLGRRPAVDHRDPHDPPVTDAMLDLTPAQPLQLRFAFEAGATAPLRGRLRIVAADARSLAGARSELRVAGVLVGELMGAVRNRLVAGAIVETVLELPPAALEALTGGEGVVEIARPPGAGSDDIMVDYAQLEVAIAR